MDTTPLKHINEALQLIFHQNQGLFWHCTFECQQFDRGLY